MTQVKVKCERDGGGGHAGGKGVKEKKENHPKMKANQKLAGGGEEGKSHRAHQIFRV